MDEHEQRAREVLGATGEAQPSKVAAVAAALRDARRSGAEEMRARAVQVCEDARRTAASQCEAAATGAMRVRIAALPLDAEEPTR